MVEATQLLHMAAAGGIGMRYAQLLLFLVTFLWYLVYSHYMALLVTTFPILDFLGIWYLLSIPYCWSLLTSTKTYWPLFVDNLRATIVPILSFAADPLPLLLNPLPLEITNTLGSLYSVIAFLLQQNCQKLIPKLWPNNEFETLISKATFSISTSINPSLADCLGMPGSVDRYDGKAMLASTIPKLSWSCLWTSQYVFGVRQKLWLLPGCE